MGVLRLLLAISVVIDHGGPIRGFRLLGGVAAVQLFFMISGFYMALILHEKYRGPGSYRLFLTNRALRIYPLYWVVLALCIVAHVAAHFVSGGDSRAIVAVFRSLSKPGQFFMTCTNLFIVGQDAAMFLGMNAAGNLQFTGTVHSTQPFLHTALLVPQAWSLSVELLFYICAPFIVRRGIGTILAMLLASLSLRYYIYAHLGLANDPWTYRFFPTELAFFLGGSLAYRAHGWLKMQPRYLPLRTRGLAVCGGGLLFCLMLPQVSIQGFNIRQWTFYVCALPSLPLLFALSQNSRLDRYLGELSYPIYIGHVLVLAVLRPALSRCGMAGDLSLFGVLGSAAAAILLIRFVGDPIERFRQNRFDQLARTGAKTQPGSTFASGNAAGKIDRFNRDDVKKRRLLKALAPARRWGGELSWVMLGQAAAFCAMLVGVRILTGALGPKQFGSLALGMTLVTLARQVVVAPMNQALRRFFAPAREAGQLRSYLHAVRRLAAASLGIVVLVSAAIMVGAWWLGGEPWLALAAAGAAFALLGGCQDILLGLQDAARLRKSAAWHLSLAEWSRCLAAAAMVMLLGATATNAMWGYAAAMVLVLASQIMVFRRWVLPLGGSAPPAAGDTSLWIARLVSYGWPYAAWGVFAWAQLAADRWSLTIFRTRSEVGYYSAFYQLGFMPMLLILQALSQFLAPIFFSAAGDGTDPGRMRRVHQLGGRVVQVGCAGCVLATIAALLFHRPLASLVLAPEFRPWSWLLPCTVLSGGLFAIGQLATLPVVSGVDTRVLIPAKITVAVVGVGLSLLGAWRLGIPGVIAANTGCSLVYMVWMLRLASRLERRRRFCAGLFTFDRSATTLDVQNERLAA